MEFFVNNGHQRIASGLVAVAPRYEQLGYIMWCGIVHFQIRVEHALG